MPDARGTKPRFRLDAVALLLILTGGVHTPALETLAGDMAEEVERRSTRLLAVLEPALIVTMFVIIGGLLLTIMIPILKLSTQAM